MIILTRRRKGDTESEEIEFPTFKEAKAAAFGFTRARIRCDSCEALSINGMFCHETGCPEAWRDSPRACRCCGDTFTADTRTQWHCRDCLEVHEEDEEPPPVLDD